MEGVVFLGDRRLELMDFPDPAPGPGEVVLEIRASGMCGSDLKYYRAPPGGGAAALGLGTGIEGPIIRGHEPGTGGAGQGRRRPVRGSACRR